MTGVSRVIRILVPVTLWSGAPGAALAAPESPAATVVGARASDERLRPRWGVELGGGLLFIRQDAFNRRLRDFGFEQESLSLEMVVTGQLAVTRALGRYLFVGMQFDTLESAGATRSIRTAASADGAQQFDWRAFGLGAFVRAGVPLVEGVFLPYVQIGAGLSLGFTRYRSDDGTADVDQSFVGYELMAAAGLQAMPWTHFGFFSQVGYGYAPVVSNLLGDVHDSGGLRGTTGIRAAF